MKKTIYYILSVFFFVGCINPLIETTTTTTKTITITENTGIKIELRNEIDSINNIVIEAIIQNNIDGLDSIKSPNLDLQGKEEFKKGFEYTNDQLVIKPQTIFNEFYAKSSHEKTEIEIKNKFEIKSIQDTIYFNIKYASAQKESYLSIFRMTTDHCERLLTLIYGKYEDKWKLDYISIGVFKINGLTSPEHLEIADSLYKHGNLTQAMTSVLLSQMCSAPMNELLTFKNQDNIKEQSDLILKDFNENYILPIDLNQNGIDGKLIGISLAPTKDSKYHLVISYITLIPIENIVQIEKENIKLHSKIEKILPGIKKGFSGIIYSISNEIPEENQKIEPYYLYQFNP